VGGRGDAAQPADVRDRALLEFEEVYAAWQGTRYALAHNTGTAALYGAFFGVGVGEAGVSTG